MSKSPKSVIRYLNLVGAEVHLMEGVDGRPQRAFYVWVCRGCKDSSQASGSVITELPEARKGANDHAAECRALPHP